MAATAKTAGFWGSWWHLYPLFGARLQCVKKPRISEARLYLEGEYLLSYLSTGNIKIITPVSWEIKQNAGGLFILC